MGYQTSLITLIIYLFIYFSFSGEAVRCFNYYYLPYSGEEATFRTRHGTTDGFQIGKGVHQGCILSPCLFNLYAEYIMRNAGLEEAQAGIKIARRNINTPMPRWPYHLGSQSLMPGNHILWILAVDQPLWPVEAV